MAKNYLCGICQKSVKVNQKGLLCTHCKKWVHISCARVSESLYDDPSELFIAWICPRCVLIQLPFYYHDHDYSPESSVRTKNQPKLDKHNAKDNQSSRVYSQLCDKGMKFVHLNIVSLLKHFDEIGSILTNNDIHILALNETRLDSSIGDNEIHVPHYNVIRNDRDRRGGGIVIYIHDNVVYEEIIVPDSVKQLEVLCILIRLKNTKPFLFVNWYRPPNKTHLLNCYEELLIYLGSFNTPIILMGDVNFNIAKHPFTGDTRKYSQLNDVYGMCQINRTECTRVTLDCSSLVDHILTTCPDKINSFGVIHNGLSDHSMSYLTWKAHINNNHSSVNYITFRKSHQIDFNKLKADLSSQNWAEVEECIDLDHAVDKWEELFLVKIDKHMPLKKTRVRKTHSPWLNENIFGLMKDRDKMKSKAKNKKEEIYWKQYRHLRNKVTFEIRRAKKKYYMEKLGSCQDRTKSWKILKTLIPNKKSITKFTCPNDECKKLANDFNEHFVNVGKQIENNESSDEDINYDETEFTENSENTDNTFYIPIITESDVLKEIYRLKNKKSAGIDGIDAFMLKTCALEILKPITFLINRSLHEGTVPSRWKVAKVIPLHKKGDKNSANNYRPISLLPCMSKILEKIVQKHLINFLQINNILSKDQSGFRPKHSTCTALTKVTDEWLSSADKRSYTGALFIDLKKAFDMVDHKILLRKLSFIGINGILHKWFYDYLSNRKMFTSINNVISKELIVTHGVPQGSILGPILFLIYINDLSNVFNSCRLHLYADDTVIYFSNVNPTVVQYVLNDELLSLSHWMSQNKLYINCEKTVCMLMGTKLMLNKHNTLNLKLGGNTINQVKNIKYLGMHIDSELKWDLHVSELVKKIGKMVSFLGRLKYLLSESYLNLIYQSVILPHFDYADIIWQSSPQTYLDQLQKLQNRAGRIILKINPSSHTSIFKIHDLLKWETLKTRRNKHMYIMLYNIFHNLTPEYMKNNLSKKETKYALRNVDNLILPKPNSNYCKRTFFYRGSKMYNELPINLRRPNTVTLFRNGLNEWIVDCYS